MSFSDFLTNLKRNNRNAAVIFDHEEPIGQATDLVMPYRPLFRRRARKSAAPRSAPTPLNDR